MKRSSRRDSDQKPSPIAVRSSLLDGGSDGNEGRERGGLRRS